MDDGEHGRLIATVIASGTEAKASQPSKQSADVRLQIRRHQGKKPTASMSAAKTIHPIGALGVIDRSLRQLSPPPRKRAAEHTSVMEGFPSPTKPTTLMRARTGGPGPRKSKPNGAGAQPSGRYPTSHAGRRASGSTIRMLF